MSTTIALLSSSHYDLTKIILLDPYLPPIDTFADSKQLQQPHQNLYSASIDSSRIIRPDYAEPAYATLAGTAQEKWRGGYGRGPKNGIVYRESGLILSANESGRQYVDKARENAQNLGFSVQALKNGDAIENLIGTGGRNGESGYMNWGSGWADSGKAMEGALTLALEKARDKEEGRVVFRRGTARRLIYKKDQEQTVVVGAELEDGDRLRVDLTILAAGAWSGALIDLRGRAEARGQVMAYVPVTESEKERLKAVPVPLNLSTGMFMIPPVKDAVTGDWSVKVARHGYGYANPTSVSPEGQPITTSLPHAKFSPIPAEGEAQCRAFLKQIIPWLSDRGFSSSRICWYTDTPSGDFLISFHPSYSGLFVATGGSGHGFKFLPVLGDKIVAGIEGRLERELAYLWRWREQNVIPFNGTEDGSRCGLRGMVLEEEWKKGHLKGHSKL